MQPARTIQRTLRRFVIGGMLACAGAAFGDSVGTVVVDAQRPALDDAKQREADSIPLATIIDARKATAAQASVADLIASEAGVRIRSRGGLGSFTSVSLRGSEESEVTVLLDGVPLSRAASGVIDLSEIPVDGLERIEIYRGAPPIALGAEAVGGVINLVSRRATTQLSYGGQVGGGSFGARAVSGHLSVPVTQAKSPRDAIVASLTGSYRGATGNFSYFDNGGTLFYSGDDHTQVRANNDFNQGNLDLTLDRRGRVPFHLGVHGFVKDQGVPGLATLGKETEHARLTTSRLLIDGEAGRHGRVDLDVQATLLFERNQFKNPLGEDVGPFGPSVTEGEAVTAGLAPRVRIPLGRWNALTLLAEGKLEHRAAYDLLNPTLALLPAVRGLFALAAADEISLLDDRLVLYGGLRFDLRRSALLVGESGTAIPDQKQLDWFLSPRVNLRWQANRVITLRASAGRFVRFPTLIEQFGDGAFILGTPALRPESSWGGDAAVTVRGAHKWVSGGLETAFFGRQATDLIAYVPGGTTVSPTNIGDARVLGIEVRGDAKFFDHVDLTCDYTFLDARDITHGQPSAGHFLPGRAPHALDVRAGFSVWRARAGYELDYLAAVPRDALGETVLPARVLHAIYGAVTLSRFELALEVHNLADTRVVALPLGGSAHAGQTAPYALVDFYNFPLPGRSFYATARFNN